MKKFAAFLMILSVSVFTMGCGGAKTKKSGAKTTTTKKTDAKKTDAKKTDAKKAGSGDKKGDGHDHKKGDKK